MVRKTDPNQLDIFLSPGQIDSFLLETLPSQTLSPSNNLNYTSTPPQNTASTFFVPYDDKDDLICLVPAIGFTHTDSNLRNSHTSPSSKSTQPQVTIDPKLAAPQYNIQIQDDVSDNADIGQPNHPIPDRRSLTSDILTSDFFQNENNISNNELTDIGRLNKSKPDDLPIETVFNLESVTFPNHMPPISPQVDNDIVAQQKVVTWQSNRQITTNSKTFVPRAPRIPINGPADILTDLKDMFDKKGGVVLRRTPEIPGLGQPLSIETQTDHILNPRRSAPREVLDFS